MKALFVFMFLSIVTVNVSVFASTNEQDGTGEKPACIRFLTVFDENVTPPFGHGLALIRYVKANPAHRIIDRKSNVFQIESQDPAGLMDFVVSRKVPVTSLRGEDGREVPLYGPPVNLERPNSSLGRVSNLYKVMAGLPPGAYTLEEGGTQETVTMFVSTAGFQRGYHYPAEFPQLKIEIWPGEVDIALPHTKEAFGKDRVAEFSNTTGAVEFWEIEQVGDDRFELGSLYSYDFGEIERKIEFGFSRSIAGFCLQEIKIHGRSYVFKSFRPRLHL